MKRFIKGRSFFLMDFSGIVRTFEQFRVLTDLTEMSKSLHFHSLYDVIGVTMKTIKTVIKKYQSSNNEIQNLLQNNIWNKHNTSFTSKKENTTQFDVCKNLLPKKYSLSLHQLITTFDYSHQNTSRQISIHNDCQKLVVQYPCCIQMTQENWSILFHKDLQIAESRKNYLFDKHSDVLPEYRSILLDWLIEICSMYKFHRETYYLTMAYFDVYVALSPKNKIVKKDLQLLGLTSLLIATKIEEMKSLPVEDIIYLSDNAYTINEILEAEKSITRILDWNCYLTTPNMWLLRFIHNIKPKINNEEYIRCTRLVDLATMDLEYLKFPNCIIAASSLELILSLDVLQETSDCELSIISRLCTKWLSKYWQEIKRIDDLVELKQNISNLPVCLCCPNFTDLSLIQAHSTNLETFNNIKCAINNKATQE